MSLVQKYPGAIAALLLILVACPTPANAVSITLTALVSDRGIDNFPRDGTFDSVFGDASVTQITTPPAGNLTSEERTAIEFPLGAIPTGATINAATLQLSPQGVAANLGLSAGETAEVHGYAGDGSIHVTDLMVSNLVGSIVGPTPDGDVLVPLSISFLQGLVDVNAAWAGLMFTGVNGPSAITFNFAGTAGGIPETQRPQLFIEFTESTAMPEPTSLMLLAAGILGLLPRFLSGAMQVRVP